MAVYIQKRSGLFGGRLFSKSTISKACDC